MDYMNNNGQRDYMFFRLKNQTYALPIQPVAQIIEMVTITPIPQMGSSIEGVINVRGDVVPVLDLGSRLGLSKVLLGAHTPIILVYVGERMMGLIVDEVKDVIVLPTEQIVSLAELVQQEVENRHFLDGLAQTELGTILLLNLEAVFGSTLIHLNGADEASLLEVVSEEEGDAGQEPKSSVEPQLVSDEPLVGMLGVEV